MARIQITQYGKSLKSGGWDPDGDSDSDAKIGNRNNRLDENSCALTATARNELKSYPGAQLKVDFGNGTVLTKFDDDTAPEDNARLDVFNYDAFVPGWPDYAEVTLA